MRRSTPPPAGQAPRTPISSINAFDAEFRSHYGYDQPATPLSAMGIIAAATGDTASSVIMGLALCIAYFAAAVMFVGALGDNRAISRRV
jgi:hypothetical protein